ncbi:unnamed protein product [Owenia fusiformis]|uniref:Uncharacterized protein n=1 Tax=Owenia fusiformis TaxID=6347 RepID=A0A8J1XSM5_OWEFU|nr:unnamed protein product [Owenia fusiformis]
MAEWVHCNNCFIQPGSNGRTFYLTNCGHMFCEICSEQCTSEKCSMCGNPCTKVALTGKMAPDVELFFTDPVELMKRHQKQLMQVMDFQKNHRQRLTSYIREKVTRQKSIIENSKKTMGQDVDREMKALREENQYLKRLIQSGRGGGGPGTPGGMRGSMMGTPTSTQRPLSGKTPSPQGNNSPFNQRANRARSPYSNEKLASQFTQPRTPSGSNRITIRGPPSHGRMGVIPQSSRTPSPQMQKLLGSAGNISIERDKRGHISPMNVSPGPSASLRRDGSKSCPLLSHQASPHTITVPTSHGYSTPVRKQIQLPPRSRSGGIRQALLSTPEMSPLDNSKT